MGVNKRSSILYFMLLTFLSACVPVVLGGGMVAVGSVAGESRSVGSQIEDSWIAMKIRNYYVRSAVVHVGNISVSVYNGKVLLTGSASNQKEIDEAIRIAKETSGVADVRSEIKIQFVSATDLARDVLITNEVKIQLLADKEVSGLDIHVKTTKEVVYLTGQVETIRERNKAISITRQVANVREVVSYIEVDTAKTVETPEKTPTQTSGN